MDTPNLQLIAHHPAQLRALLDGHQAYASVAGRPAAEGMRGFISAGSPEFLARVAAATEVDPWVFGFAIVLRAHNTVIGSAGFKAPPGPDRTVEIAYGIVPGFEGQGFATEVVGALLGYATAGGRVETVTAHTLPERNASARVLEKCGFEWKGEVMDPDDGRVWRWERTIERMEQAGG